MFPAYSISSKGDNIVLASFVPLSKIPTSISVPLGSPKIFQAKVPEALMNPKFIQGRAYLFFLQKSDVHSKNLGGF